MTTTDQPPLRIHLTKEELEKLSRDELAKNWALQERYIDTLESRSNENKKLQEKESNSKSEDLGLELVSLRESEEKLKQQQLEATRRENVLVMRLTTKEHEMQEYANQIQELKQAQIPSVAQLRSALLDPAVNLMFEKMRKELDTTKARLEETQNELSAWKFTPDSNTGKRLMAKCRLLYQENEELGKMISSGRMAKLEGDLALQRNFSEEMKKSQSELDEFLLELDEDVEGMQGTIYYLQQQLREAKDQIYKLQQENQKLSILVGTSPTNHHINVDDNTLITDTEGDQSYSPMETRIKDDDDPLPHVINNIKSTQVVNNDQKQNGTSITNSWPLTYDENRTSDQNISGSKSIQICSLPEEECDDSHSSVDHLQIHDDGLSQGNECEEDISVSSVGETSDAAAPQVPLHIDVDESTQESVQESTTFRTPKSLSFNLPNEQNVTEEDKTVKKENTHSEKNHNDDSEWASSKCQNVKRTREESPEDSTTEEDSGISPSPKRIKQEEVSAQEDIDPAQRTQLEINTDTEVQVAQTLAWWASASKERKEAHINTHDNSNSVDSLGNGEVEVCASEEETT